MIASLKGPFLALAISALATVAAHAQPRHGGTLNWVVNPIPTSLIPLTTSAGGSSEIGPKVVEGLLTYGYDLQPKPLLATAWSMSADGLQYTFTLREGVTWHDGRASRRRCRVLDPALKPVHPRGRATFANVIEVSTPNPNPRSRLSKPAPSLLIALAASESPIVPKHLYEGTDIATNKYNSAPVGTGPFVFKEWVHGSHAIFERNPNYWDKPKPYLDRAIARFIPDAVARAASLESGALDLGNAVIPLSDVERFKKLPQLRVDSDDWPYWGNDQQVIFNLDSPLMKNLEVRRAIAQAIDVNAYNNVVWFGYGRVSASPIGLGLARYHDASIKHQPYDPKKAEAILDAAGHKREANGMRFKLRLLYNPFLERRTADFLRQSLSRVGINAEIESFDFPTYVKKVYTDRAFDMTAESLLNLFDPTVGVQRVFWSKNFKIGLPFSNAAHYEHADVDRFLEAASVEVDDQKRRELFVAFQKQVEKDIPSIELGANPNITVAAKKVQNYQPTAEGIRGSFADLYFAP